MVVARWLTLYTFLGSLSVASEVMTSSSTILACAEASNIANQSA